MKTHQKILTGAILLLTGMLISMIFMVYYVGVTNAQRPQVTVTELTRSIGFADNAEEAAPRSLLPNLKTVAESVTPTVVYIETIIPVRRQEMPDDEIHSDESLWNRLMPNRRTSGIGSGVLVSADGYIITNNHVIAGADSRRITVTLNDKRVFPATIIGTDPSTDLAVIKIDESMLPYAIIGNSDELVVGDWVVAIGNPFRLRSTVTAGIVSALGRNMDIINDQMRIENFIQTDAAINRGNSGGALLNEYGELIGINTAIVTENGSYQGYGFAIPINMAFKITSDLIEFGEVRRAYLGVQIVSVGQERARQLKLATISGVEIVSLLRNGAAEKAGLLPNDVILTVNSAVVNEANELQAQIAMFRPGDNVNLSVWRNGRAIDIQMALGGLTSENL
jgi:Do/DeqQ family serine protease